MSDKEQANATSKEGSTPSSSNSTGSSTKKASGKKRFEVKKWNAVALWAWDIVVDYCAICRNHIMDLCRIFYYLIFIFHFNCDVYCIFFFH